MAKKPKGLRTQFSADGGGQNSTELDHTKTGQGSVLYVEVYQELTIGGLAEAVLAALGARPIHTIH